MTETADKKGEGRPQPPLTDRELAELRGIIERERTIGIGMRWLRALLGWVILIGGVIATWGPIKDVIKGLMK